jgi:hypothetical protein
LGDRGRRISEFKASLVYKVSSRTARTIQRNPVLEKKKPKKKKKERKKKKGTGSLMHWLLWATWLFTGHFHEYQRPAGNMGMDKPN